MLADYRNILSLISRYAEKPALFEPGELRFWDDPHISKGMLEAHLNPDNNVASRKHKTIDKEVEHLTSSGILKPGDKLLDLGCGPGLYASRLAARGVKVTGIDISERSLNCAIAQARKKNLDIKYRLVNFFDLNYSSEFDAAIQTNGELNTFSDEKLNELLGILRRALKPGGMLIFDITTRKPRTIEDLKNNWYAANGGFWRPGKHLVLEQILDYPEDNVWLDQFIIIDNDTVKVYHNWFHDYNLKAIRRVLKNAGFTIRRAWNDLTGTPYKAGGDCLAIAAEKR